MGVIIGCSVAAEQWFERGSGGAKKKGMAAAMLVYGSIVLMFPACMLAMRSALPFPLDGAGSPASNGGAHAGASIDPAAEAAPPRLPKEGWTACCALSAVSQQ